LLQGESKHDLPPAEVTLAERLHDAGYATAIVGKWHLGDGDHAPETQGFDVSIGGTRWGGAAVVFSGRIAAAADLGRSFVTFPACLWESRANI